MYYSNIKLIGNCDGDSGGCLDDMKSTSGFAFSIGLCHSFMGFQEQQHSTAKAAYVPAALAVSQAIWLRKIYEDIEQI